MGEDLEFRKKTRPEQNANPNKWRFKKRYWLLVDLVVMIIVFALLLHKPGSYAPPEVARDGKVSPYLTHELLPRLYNGAQQQEPFDLVVTQKGINDTVASSEWPKESQGTVFSAPEVFFAPDRIILMGTATVGGVAFVVTVAGEPTLDQRGLLNLRVVKVKVGAMNITPLARIVAKKMYRNRVSTTDVNTDDIGTKILASLLNNEPFEPVFPVKDGKVRVEKITLEQEKLTLRLVPIFD